MQTTIQPPLKARLQFINQALNAFRISIFVVFVAALNMLIPATALSSALAASLANELEIPIAIIGIILAFSMFGLSLADDNPRIQLVCIAPLLIFIAGLWWVVFKKELAWQGVILYTGFALHLLSHWLQNMLRKLPNETA